MDNEGDNLDLNFFDDKSEAVSSPCYTVDELSSASNSPLKNSFSILQINIRSMNKNFEKLQKYLNAVMDKFSIVALTEMCCNDDGANKNSAANIRLHTYSPNYINWRKRSKYCFICAQ